MDGLPDYLNDIINAHPAFPKELAARREAELHAAGKTEELFYRNLGWLLKQIRRKKATPQDVGDLFSVGMSALFKCAEKWTPYPGKRFMDYAWLYAEDAMKKQCTVMWGRQGAVAPVSLNAENREGDDMLEWSADTVLSTDPRVGEIGGVGGEVTELLGLRTLPVYERRVLELSIFAETPLPFAEIAKELGVREETVLRRSRKALDRLREIAERN